MRPFSAWLGSALAALLAGQPVRAAPPAMAAPAADLAEVRNFSCAGAARHEGQAFRTTLAGVPAVVRWPAKVSKPPIVLWHGYAAPASEGELMQALPLDEAPAIKVYLGLPLFGARSPAADEESLSSRQQYDFALRLFKPVVLGAAAELPAVVDDLRRKGCLAAGQKIGLFGFSAGGAAALEALAGPDAQVSVAVIVNAPTGLTPSIQAMERATGRPYAWSDAARALARQADVAARPDDVARGSPPPALLLIQGADDAVVTPQGAIDLQHALEPAYDRAGGRGRLAVELLTGVPHNWTQSAQLARLRTAVADWFDRFL